MVSFIFIQFLILLANSGNPDQTPRYVASDLDLHCLPLSHKKDARLIWANIFTREIRLDNHLSEHVYKSMPLSNRIQMAFCWWSDGGLKL